MSDARCGIDFGVAVFGKRGVVDRAALASAAQRNPGLSILFKPAPVLRPVRRARPSGARLTAIGLTAIGFTPWCP
jgi:hypothetical protein